MPKTSAGILLFRRNPDLDFFLAHPGGPYWTNKDAGAWSIPKGEIEENEDKLKAAIREFEEETGFKPEGEFLDLGTITQKGGKKVYAWAVETEPPDNHQINSNVFEIEWPPNSGLMKQFPEIDRADFFSREVALDKINSSQAEFIHRLIDQLQKV